MFFLTGIVVGGVVAAAGVAWHWNGQFQDWYVLQVADSANVAKEIYSGRGEELANRIRGSLPQYARRIESTFADAEGAPGTIWLIADVFEASDLPLPDELRSTLDSLPPRPSCPLPSREW